MYEKLSLVEYIEDKLIANDKHTGDDNKVVKNYKIITCHFHHKCNQCASRTRESR